MTWVYLDDKFHSNPKTVGVGNDGAGLYCRALSYCGDQLTDGYVPLGWAREVGKPGTRIKVTGAGFWLEVFGGEQYHYVADDAPYTVTIPGPGFFIPDYLMLNPTRMQVERKRNELSAKRSAAGKLGAQKRWQDHDKDDGGKKRARDIANTALKAGRINRTPCEDCGSPTGLQMHHEDYSKPETVVWLCRSCHGNRHGNRSGKTMAGGVATGWQPDGPQPLPLKEQRAVTEARTAQPPDFKIPNLRAAS